MRLLQELRDLRLTLETDLAAAAGALDADQASVARDIVMGDRTELRGFHDRARQIVAGQGHDAGSQAAATPAVPTPRSRSRRRRVLLALPAVPLVGALAMSAALALGAGSHGSSAHLPTPVRSTTSTSSQGPVAFPSGTQRADATLQQLESVVGDGSSSARILSVASRFHHQVTALLQDLPGGATEVSEVQTLLVAEQRLLRHHDSPATRTALRASERLSSRLLGQLGSPTSPSPRPLRATPPATNSSALPSTAPSRRRGHPTSPPSPATPTPSKGTPYPVLGTGTPLPRRQL